MRKMREIDGYMTLEASLIVPVICFLLVLLFSFFFYIMDLGIVSGTVKEAGLGGSVHSAYLRQRKRERSKYRLKLECRWREVWNSLGCDCLRLRNSRNLCFQKRQKRSGGGA